MERPNREASFIKLTHFWVRLLFSSLRTHDSPNVHNYLRFPEIEIKEK